MKRLILFAAILALSLPTIHSAYAREHEGDRQEARGHGNDKHVEHDRGHGQNFDEERGRSVENHVFREGRDFGYHRVANGPKFKYKGRAYVAVNAPRFIYPRGWGYRHWAPGAFLPALFIAEPYYIDFGWIGLPPPPPGYRWVRYGPDALLVNVYTGRIADVAYDVFI